MFNFENLSVYRLFIGLNDQKEKIQLIETEDALRVVNEYIWANFGGGTVYEGFGVYKHDDGTVVREKSVIVELFYITDDEVKLFVEHLKDVLNQESVTVMKLNADVCFAQFSQSFYSRFYADCFFISNLLLSRKVFQKNEKMKKIFIRIA